MSPGLRRRPWDGLVLPPEPSGRRTGGAAARPAAVGTVQAAVGTVQVAARLGVRRPLLGKDRSARGKRGRRSG